MSMQIGCPGCGKKLAVPETARGKKIKCPSCQKVMAIPAPKTAAQPAQQPAASATITLGCPCGSKLKVPTTARGKNVRCPKCQSMLAVPAGGTAPAAAAPAVATPAPIQPPTAAPAPDPFGAPAADPFGAAPAADPFAAAPAAPMAAPSNDPFGNLPSPAAPVTGGAGQFPSYTPPAANPNAGASRDQAALAAAGAFRQSPEEKLGATVAAAHPSSRDWGEFFFNRIHIAIFIMLLAGPVVSFFGWKTMNKLAALDANGVTVQGIVMEAEERRGRKGSRTYKMTVMFVTEDKQALTDEFSVNGSFFKQHIVGNELSDAPVSVKYNPDDPSEAIIVGGSTDSSIGLWIGIGMFLIGVCGTCYIVFVGDIDW